MPKHLQRLLPVFLLVVVVGTGCSSGTYLPPAPNLLRTGPQANQLDRLPESLHTADMEILYLTDRSAAEEVSAIGPEYGFGRATRVAFGYAQVGLKPSPSWDELVAASSHPQNAEKYELKLKKIDEVGDLLLSIDDVECVDGSTLKLRDESETALETSANKLRKMIEDRLAETPDKDVYLYIHGFNNTFYDAVTRAAILWHYIGRKGVFIAYTWPAGRGGALGYFYDRESGEFTILHLRETIKAIAKSPKVERLHIIAHSRGADVSSTALREINIDCKAKGAKTHELLKLETIILAAPDLDIDVFGQRFFFENLAGAANRTVIYYSGADKAIGMAQWLFSSKSRLGQLSKMEMAAGTRRLLNEYTRFQLVDCQVWGFSTSHAYVFGNPAAMSDVIRVLRDRADPGPQRPLVRQENGTWLLDNNYLLPPTK